MEPFNIMIIYHTSAGNITVDTKFYNTSSTEEETLLNIEDKIGEVLHINNTLLRLQDAITKKQVVVMSNNIIKISYDRELLLRKVKAGFRKESERLVTVEQLKDMFDKRPSPKYEAILGEVTYQDSIPGGLTVESPSKSTVISDVSPDWLINVDHTTKGISTEEFLERTKK